MATNIDLPYGAPAIAPFFRMVQEALSGLAHNVQLQRLNDTTVRLPAGAGDERVDLAIGGKLRYRTTDIDVVDPGGVAATHYIWATCEDNNFTGPPEAIDLTDYDFSLAITATDVAPTGAGIAFTRRIGTLQWTGTTIVPGSVETLVGATAGSGGSTYGTIVTHDGPGTRSLTTLGDLSDDSDELTFSIARDDVILLLASLEVTTTTATATVNLRIDVIDPSDDSVVWSATVESEVVGTGQTARVTLTATGLESGDPSSLLPVGGPYGFWLPGDDGTWPPPGYPDLDHALVRVRLQYASGTDAVDITGERRQLRGWVQRFASAS